MQIYGATVNYEQSGTSVSESGNLVCHTELLYIVVYTNAVYNVTKT